MKRQHEEEKKLAHDVASAINNFSFSNTAFAEEMGREHRTLQQSFTRLCMEWICYLAQVEHYDARNEDSVKLAKEIVSKVDNIYLPMV